MNRAQSLLMAALLALASVPAAQAVSNVSVAGAGHEVLDLIVDADARSLGLDADLRHLGPLTLSFTLDAEDIAAGYAFDSTLGNLSGALFDGLALQLSHGRFVAGAASGVFAPVAPVELVDGGRSARLASLGGEAYGFVLGDPTGDSGLPDWRFDFSGLSAGQTVSLSVSAIPEPESWALCAAGLAALAVARRRVRR